MTARDDEVTVTVGPSQQHNKVVLLTVIFLPYLGLEFQLVLEQHLQGRRMGTYDCSNFVYVFPSRKLQLWILPGR